MPARTPTTWFVTWWVDDPDDRRIEIDVSLPPERTERRLDATSTSSSIRSATTTARVEVQDHDEFESRVPQRLDRARATPRSRARYGATAWPPAHAREEPWGDEGWHRLARRPRAKCTRSRLLSAGRRRPRACPTRSSTMRSADFAERRDWQNALGGCARRRHRCRHTSSPHAAGRPGAASRSANGRSAPATSNPVATAPGRQGLGARFARDGSDRSRSSGTSSSSVRCRRAVQRVLRAARRGSAGRARPSSATTSARRSAPTEDDDGLMVLRFGAQREQPISPRRSSATPAPATTGERCLELWPRVASRPTRGAA